MRVEPIGDKVIVKRVDNPDETEGGIFLPESAKTKSQEGKVLSVGAGRIDANGKRTPLQIKEGDRVIFTSYAGTEVDIDGEEILIMLESDILAVLV